MSYGSSKWSPWVLDETESISMIKKAYDAGINFFDTADAYSNGESERILGKAIRELNIPRENVVIASKVYFPVAEDITVNTFRGNLPKSVSSINAGGLSRKHIFDAIDASLKRLQMDYIDLYQVRDYFHTNTVDTSMGL
jgi:aryl-alcohol dehydrogenase-like predicted oxidoreductase